MSRVPRIRFKGFEEDWEQRKLEYYLEVSEERNLSNEYTKENVLSVSGDVGIVNQIEFQGRSFAGILVNNYGVVKTGYVVYTKSPLKTNPYGIIKANKGRDGIVSTLYAIYKPKLNVNSNFIQIYFEQNARMNNYMQPLVNKGAKNDMKISSGNALKGNVIFPIRKEQDIIVDLFFKIDHLITLHQRKLEKLKIIKKSMLENLFPQNGEKTPKIRFSGFTKDWEQRKVNEIIEDYIEKTTIQNQYTVLTSSQQKGIVYQEEYFSDRQVTTNANIGYYVLPRGYFTYRSRSDTNVFVFNRNDIIDKGIISYYYPVFFNKNSDSNFLLRRLNTGIERQIIMAAEGTGQHVLAHSKFKNMDIFVPYLDEQKRIGKYFESLDHLITLHQSKSFGHILKAIVSCTLSWEQRKLGEIADIIGGGTPSTLNLDYWDGNIDWYSPAEIIDQIYVDRSQRKITELGFEKSSAKMLPEGTVLFTSRAGIGKTAILAKKGCTNQGFQSIVPHSNKLDSYFIFSRTEELKKYGELVGAGSTFVEVSGRQMENMQLMIPKTIGEQHIIGVLFSTVDHLITLHQSKLDKLQKIKKSMLESMFV